MDIESPETLARIGELNDNFRTMFHGGEIVFTQSFIELPDMVKAAALQLVAEFKDFNEEERHTRLRVVRLLQSRVLVESGFFHFRAEQWLFGSHRLKENPSSNDCRLSAGLVTQCDYKHRKS